MVLGALLLLAIALAYGALRDSQILAVLLDGQSLRAWLRTLGIVGPLAIVGLMIAAVLISPIPSAPIAVAAGAAYGHTWGTVYVLAGAEAGALAAFGLARLLGREVMRRWFGDRLETGLLGSQNALMGVVFASRLLPFVSFDIVSYAAGLTSLAPWRFALATLAGIVPASFLLAHFGNEMVSEEGDRIMVTVAALGLITAIPIAAKVARTRLWRSRGFRTGTRRELPKSHGDPHATAVREDDRREHGNERPGGAR